MDNRSTGWRALHRWRRRLHAHSDALGLGGGRWLLVAVRGVEFSRMVFLRYLPDIWVTLPGAGTYKPVLRVATALILIYEALQLFWLYNIGIAMVDRARGGDGAPPAAVSQR